LSEPGRKKQLPKAAPELKRSLKKNTQVAEDRRYSVWYRVICLYVVLTKFAEAPHQFAGIESCPEYKMHPIEWVGKPPMHRISLRHLIGG